MSDRLPKHASKTILLSRAAAFAVAALLGRGLASANDGTGVSFTGTGLSQNFDTLPNTPDIGNNPTPPPVPNGFTDNSTLAGWYSLNTSTSAGNTSLFYVSSGIPKSGKTPATMSGALYSLGPVGSTNRSLGAVATSGSGDVYYGVKLFNDTASTTYSSFTVGYKGEEWFTGGDPNTTKALNFSYGFNLNSLNASGQIGVSNLTYTALVSGTEETFDGSTTNATKAGGTYSPQQVSSTVQTTGWAPGQSLTLVWRMPAGAQGQALSIDDFSFNATPATSVGRSITWNPGSTTWNKVASNTNWLTTGSAATNFNDGDAANFTNTGVGTVNVDAGGVNPSQTNVSNSTGTYTFSGGPVGGAQLTKTNAGTLVLSSPNSFNQLNVFGGTVATSADANLGAAGSGVSIDNGATLQLQGTFSTNRPLTINSGGGTVDTQANNFTTTTALTLNGPLTKAGNGSWTVTGAMTPAAAGVFTLAGGSMIFNGTGTQGFVAPAATGGFNGSLVVATPVRLSIDGGLVNGTGDIQIQSSGAALIGATPAGSTGPTTLTLDVPIRLNTLNATGTFNSVIGMSTAGNQMVLTPNAVISGNSNVIFSNSQTGGGAGSVLINSLNTYTGSTTINFSSGYVQLGIDNALPTATSLTFGDGTVTANLGGFDLNGHNQTFSSIATNLPNAGATTPQQASGITNSGGGINTLTIKGSANTTFDAVIGTNNNAGVVGSDNVALTLDAANTGKLVLSGANTYNGGTTINGGTLQFDPVALNPAASSLPAGSNVTNNASLIINAPASSAGIINGNGTTTVTSNGVLSANNLTQGTVANSGALTVNTSGSVGTLSGTGSTVFGYNGQPATATIGSFSQNAVTINGGSLVTLAGPSQIASVTNSLTMATGSSGAKLDLTNNGLVLNYTGTSPLPTIQGLIASGKGGNNGIYSTNATNNPGVVTVGYGEASDLFPTGGTFLGRSIQNAPSAVLIRTTFFGDANLDGVVNIKDIRLVNSGGKYNTGQAATWTQGDFNNDGVFNIKDIRALNSAGQYNSGIPYTTQSSAVTLTSADTATGHSTTSGTGGDGKPDLLYNPKTGDVSLSYDGSAANITEIDMVSGGSKFIVTSSTPTGPFGSANSGEIDYADVNPVANGFDFGDVLPANLTQAQLDSDLTLTVYRKGGSANGEAADAIATAVPEPTGLALLGLGGRLLARRRR